MKKLNRRQFLSLSASSAGAILLSQCGKFQSQPIEKSQISLPQVYSSADGLLAVDLSASYDRVNLAGKPAYLLNYNGRVPGPRLEVKAGDTVRLDFTNNLSEPTNLHYHGLHVSPTGNADNVFLEIPSQETFTYEFTIPKNHPAGMFWYHPHRHGLVAEQVFGGLVGLLIVRGELDEIPEIRAAQEEFLVLKDFDLDRKGRIVPPTPMAQMRGREGQLLTVNGQVNPILSLPAGGLLRLRILNASASRFYRLALADHPLYLIATDGGSLSAPVEVRELLLSPGERAEVLVRGEREPGEYSLLNLPYNRGGRGMMGGSSAQGKAETLATVVYNGSISSMALPEQLMAVEALPEPQTVRRFQLNHGMARGRGMVFLIDRQMFNPNRIDTQVQLDTVEDWELANTGVMDHPFHVHVNPFQVISRNGKPVPDRAWKDTVNVAPGEIIRCRLRFDDFAGKTVYHCHILDHEDLGMMGILEILG